MTVHNIQVDPIASSLDSFLDFRFQGCKVCGEKRRSNIVGGGKKGLSINFFAVFLVLETVFFFIRITYNNKSLLTSTLFSRKKNRGA